MSSLCFGFGMKPHLDFFLFRYCAEVQFKWHTHEQPHLKNKSHKNVSAKLEKLHHYVFCYEHVIFYLFFKNICVHTRWANLQWQCAGLFLTLYKISKHSFNI